MTDITSALAARRIPFETNEEAGEVHAKPSYQDTASKEFLKAKGFKWNSSDKVWVCKDGSVTAIQPMLKEEAMQPTISLLGQRASATIFCSNLILDNDRLIVLLSAYGPSQEVRAFAQILYDREAPLLEIPGKKSNRVQLGGTVSLIGKMDNGYSGLYILPDRHVASLSGTTGRNASPSTPASWTSSSSCTGTGISLCSTWRSYWSP